MKRIMGPWQFEAKQFADDQIAISIDGPSGGMKVIMPTEEAAVFAMNILDLAMANMKSRYK